MPFIGKVCSRGVWDESVPGIEKKYKSIKQYWPISKLLVNNYTIDKNKFNYKAKREQNHLLNCKYVIGRTAWDYRITRVLAPKSKYYHNDEIIRGGFYVKKWDIHRNDSLTIHSTTGPAFYKGFETICQTISILNRLGINHEWRIAGLKENDLIVRIVRKKLKGLYPQNGLVFLGRLNEAELITKMLEANIFVMASHIENSPNNLCEAMLLGMPCIATFAGGTASLLDDGKEGTLIQSGDPWVMAGSIIELYSSLDLQLKYSENARLRALLRHNPLKISKELEEIYEKIIQQHNSFKV
jgi:glycosyltransferase involved in cell wall biosynthesis